MELRRLSGITAIGGGLLWALVPLLDGIYPTYELLVGILPLLLAGGVYGIHRTYDTSRSDIVLMASGLGFLLVAALIFTWARLTAGSIAFVLLTGLPAGVGMVLVALGTGKLAHRLWKLDAMPSWLAVGFSAALPLDPLVNALVTPLFSFGVSVYGLSWILVGWWLFVRPPESKPVATSNRPTVK
ncbi:hypothetical protein ACFPYI_04400 [Halomarina salina]|uniref:DUF308 domain-containing protein n=1 Tax=Halomarina salina TaxID=1872699 RepID=A0ABD5RJB3_9EURY|nr:hypothetical protein [Halomarina salina]